MRLAHAGARVRDLKVTAYNGRLFSPAEAQLDNLRANLELALAAGKPAIR